MTSLADTIHHHFGSHGLQHHHGSSSGSGSASGPSSQPIPFASNPRRLSHANAHAPLQDDDEDRGAAASGEEEEDEEYSNAAAEEGAQEMMNEQTVKAGYLWKKGEKRKTWKKRWFVLRSSKLCYYKNEKEYQLLRYIDMSEVHSVAAIQLKRQDNTFGIVTPKRAYYVKASTAAETQEWIRALNDIKTQLSQRNTMTNDFADLQMSGIRDAGSPTSPISTTSTARPLSAADLGERSHSAAQAAAATSAASAAAAVAAGRSQHQQQPISINVPGRGNHTSPAQPRPIPNTPDALSPLTATTDSETGAEHYGLSYTSSMTGQSFGSSPGRDTSHGSELSDSGGPLQRRGSQGYRTRGQGSSSSQRRHDGSSGGEQGGGGPSSYQSAGGAAVLSSSEEEDDVDEKEQLDRAMPLPTMATSQSGISASTTGSAQQPTSASSANPAPQAQGIPTAAQTQSTSASSAREGNSLLRDPNRVIVQGYLMKQSNRRKTWRKRWFVLTASRLMYTRSHMDGRAHRQIPLESILDAIEHASKKSYSSGGGSTAPSSPSLQQAQIGGAAVGFHSLGEGGEGNGVTHEGAAGNGARRGSSGAVFATSPSGQALSLPEGATSNAGGATASQSAAGPAKPERRQSVVAAAAAAAAAGVSSGLNLGSSSGSGGAAHSSAGSNTSGSNNVQGGSSSHNAAKRMDNCFKIITPKRVFLLCAPTEEEEIKWLSALQALLTRSRGQQQVEGSSVSASVGNPSTQAASNSTTLSPTNPAQAMSDIATSSTTTTTSPRLS